MAGERKARAGGGWRWWMEAAGWGGFGFCPARGREALLASAEFWGRVWRGRLRSPVTRRGGGGAGNSQSQRSLPRSSGSPSPEAPAWRLEDRAVGTSGEQLPGQGRSSQSGSRGTGQARSGASRPRLPGGAVGSTLDMSTHPLRGYTRLPTSPAARAAPSSGAGRLSSTPPPAV